MLFGICIINISFLVLVCPGNERKEPIVLDYSCRYFDRVFLTAITKRIHIVTRRGDSDDKFVLICFHRLFESVILSWFFICRQLVTNCKVTVKGILRIGIARECDDFYFSIWATLSVFENVFDTMVKTIVLDFEFIN